MASKTYLAVDIGPMGRSLIDQFAASNDVAAARRAIFAAEGVVLELWREDQLLGRWLRVGKKFTPVALGEPALAGGPLLTPSSGRDEPSAR